MPLMLSRTFLILTAVFTGFFSLQAQTASQITRSSPGLGPMSDVGGANLPGQKIGPEDLVAVSVYDAPELTRTVRVSSEGYIKLPMLKSKLKAMDLLPSELETVVATALQDEGILIEPVVLVTVAEYKSRPINVMGAVRKPLTFQAAGTVTLLEALGKAEGLSEAAGPEILVSRRSDPRNPDSLTVQRVAVRDLIDNARQDVNFQLIGGEDIRVPEARKIYVAGNVKKPGAIPVKDGSPVTILKALGMSEGLTPYYKKTIFILRPDEAGAKREIPVELSQILDRKSEDIALQPEDILYIPDDNRKRVTMNIIEKTAVFATGTVSGMLIWRGR